MAVSLATASKAVEAWNLDRGGRPIDLACGCREWTWNGPLGLWVKRLVRQCPSHRPSWLAGVISNADR